MTGIDADRLEEEKRRGITIDIGFAHRELTPELRVGFVDVPGHERFVKNMLAGVGGIDLVLFVVAADESIKPQTREHFEICRLLGIREGIVVLTKADLVDRDIVDLVRLEVEEFVKGSFLEGAPVVAVSSETGEGLDDLRKALVEAAARAQAKDARGFARLPIDRAFSMKGFGTVVTGTLVSGTIAREDELELYPTGRKLRVRGLQVFGKSVNKAAAGQRTAVNVADIEPGEITRGMQLAAAGKFRAAKTVDVALEMLKPLKNGAPVHFHAGTAEVTARVRLLENGYARLRLSEPVLVMPRDRFIVRRFSPVTTIGGGRVVDTGAAKHTPGRLAVLDGEDAGAKVALLVRESKAGLRVRDAVARTGLPEEEVRRAPVRVVRDWLIDPAWFERQKRAAVEQVRVFHGAHPLLAGMPKGTVAAPEYVLDELLAAAPELAVEGDLVRLRTHRVVLKEDETEARAKIEAAFEKAGLAVPGMGEVLAGSGVEDKRARGLLQILIKEKRLVKIGADLVFHTSALDKLRGLLAQRKGERFGVPSFKEWTGISRKYAIPLLEYLDREHITRREGDERVVL